MNRGEASSVLPPWPERSHTDQCPVGLVQELTRKVTIHIKTGGVVNEMVSSVPLLNACVVCLRIVEPCNCLHSTLVTSGGVNITFAIAVLLVLFLLGTTCTQ